MKQELLNKLKVLADEIQQLQMQRIMFSIGRGNTYISQNIINRKNMEFVKIKKDLKKYY